MHTKEVHDPAHLAQGMSEESLQASWSSLQQKSTDVRENVLDYVTENPVKALSFAALSGMLLAQFLRHK